MEAGAGRGAGRAGRAGGGAGVGMAGKSRWLIPCRTFPGFMAD